MSSARATTIAQGFSQKLLLEMYDKSMLDTIVNRDYEGEINQIGSVLNILNFARIKEKTYASTPMSPDSLYENNCVLTINQFKSFYWSEKTIDNWESYIKNPHPTVIAQKAEERNRNMDLYALKFWAKVAAGNRVGTDYTTGSVAVDVSGNVTGNGTTFTAAMVGRGFKANGMTSWERVKSYSSATAIVIEDDYDDTASAYTGGVIGAGATYIVEAATPLTVTTANFAQYIGQLKVKLDSAERNGKNSVPDDGRWLLLPPEGEEMLTRSTGILLHVPDSFEELVKKGMITQLKGFNVFKTNRLDGDNTNGFHILAGHPNWLTFAEKLLEADIEEVILGDFGASYKDLFVYGGKVADSRRSQAAELYCIFSG